MNPIPDPATTRWVPIGPAALPAPVVNGQWIKGAGGVPVWAQIQATDVYGLVALDLAWCVVGAAGQPAFQNGYTSWDNRTPRFRRLASGLVVLAGILGCPTTSGLVAFTLPAGYRPATAYGDMTFWVNGVTQPVLANLFPDGRFIIGGGGTYPAGGWCYIDGVRFLAEA